MTNPQAAAPPSIQRTASRTTAGLRQASLAILIVLIVQFTLGMGVNLYVTNIDIANIGVKIGLAFLIGGLLLILSIILGIVWLVRRSRNKRVLPA